MGADCCSPSQPLVLPAVPLHAPSPTPRLSARWLACCYGCTDCTDSGPLGSGHRLAKGGRGGSKRACDEVTRVPHPCCQRVRHTVCHLPNDMTLCVRMYVGLRTSTDAMSECEDGGRAMGIWLLRLVYHIG